MSTTTTTPAAAPAPYDTTWAAFREARRQGVYDEYGPGKPDGSGDSALTHAEIARLYPDHALWAEYSEAVRRAVEDNRPLTTLVLDRIWEQQPGFCFYLLKHHRRRIPEGYFTPDVRKRHADELREAQARRGRQRRAIAAARRGEPLP